MQEEMKDFFYLLKSTLIGFTCSVSRFSSLSYRVSSWDSLLRVSSLRKPNQMRRVPQFFSPQSRMVSKMNNIGFLKKDLKLSKSLDLGGGAIDDLI